MISRIEKMRDLPEPTEAFSLRIVSAAQAYGLQTVFLDIWKGGGCLFSRMDGVLTIAGEPAADSIEETSLFVASCGTEQIFCNPQTAVKLGLSVIKDGPVLYRDQPGKADPLPPEFPSPRELYRVLAACESETFPVPDFEAFYLDTSHRLRHKTAEAVLLQKENAPAACALALAVTEKAALLTAAAVCPDFRRKGLGSHVVEKLCRILPGRRIFLFREKSENQEFYRTLKFSPGGEWAECALK